MTKTMKELKIPKLKDFITLQNILFEKDSMTNKGMTSFNKIFQQSIHHVTKIQEEQLAR